MVKPSLLARALLLTPVRCKQLASRVTTTGRCPHSPRSWFAASVGSTAEPTLCLCRLLAPRSMSHRRAPLRAAPSASGLLPLRPALVADGLRNLLQVQHHDAGLQRVEHDLPAEPGLDTRSVRILINAFSLSDCGCWRWRCFYTGSVSPVLQNPTIDVGIEPLFVDPAVVAQAQANLANNNNPNQAYRESLH